VRSYSDDCAVLNWRVDEEDEYQLVKQQEWKQEQRRHEEDGGCDGVFEYCPTLTSLSERTLSF
jgi:hypothetical protein